MKRNITTIRELCEFIWHLEDKYYLFNYEIDEVKVWQYSCMDIYYKLEKKLNILEKVNISRNSFSSIINNFWCLLKKLLLYSPFLKTDNRSKLVDNETMDMYRKYFINKLNNTKLKFNLKRLFFEKTGKLKISHCISTWLVFWCLSENYLMPWGLKKI